MEWPHHGPFLNGACQEESIFPHRPPCLVQLAPINLAPNTWIQLMVPKAASTPGLKFQYTYESPGSLLVMPIPDRSSPNF